MGNRREVEVAGVTRCACRSVIAVTISSAAVTTVTAGVAAKKVNINTIYLNYIESMTHAFLNTLFSTLNKKIL